MKWILVLLLVAAAGATLFVLIKGVIGMAQQKDITGQRSQELMREFGRRNNEDVRRALSAE